MLGNHLDLELTEFFLVFFTDRNRSLSVYTPITTYNYNLLLLLLLIFLNKTKSTFSAPGLYFPNTESTVRVSVLGSWPGGFWLARGAMTRDKRTANSAAQRAEEEESKNKRNPNTRTQAR